MARRKNEEAPPRTDAWMSTFSDLMNLLMCFFVLLFAMSTVDADKWEQLVASFSSSYSVLDSSSGMGVQDGKLIASGTSQLNELREYYSQMGLGQDSVDNENEKNEALLEFEKQQMEESEQMGDKIEQILQDKGLVSEVEVQVTQSYVSLNMKGSLLFASGSAELTEDARAMLSNVADVLKTYDGNLIEIEGHTDNVPINSGIYTSNMVLSAYRALSVWEFFVNEKGLSTDNLKSAGRGEYAPIASNDTAEGRSQNRRVEIKIYNSYSSNAR